MPDRAKVIRGLEVCLKNIDQQDCPSDCPYLSDCSEYKNRVVFQPLMRDALALLKEQETSNAGGARIFKCEKCGYGFDDIYLSDEYNYDINPNYCPNCGRAVKWE